VAGVDWSRRTGTEAGERQGTATKGSGKEGGEPATIEIHEMTGRREIVKKKVGEKLTEPAEAGKT
jgi:hypothetical protein